MATFYNNTPYTTTLVYWSTSWTELGRTTINSMTSSTYSPPSGTYQVGINTSGIASYLSWTSSKSSATYPLEEDAFIQPTGSSWPNVTLDTDEDYCDCDCYTSCDCDCYTSCDCDCYTICDCDCDASSSPYYKKYYGSFTSSKSFSFSLSAYYMGYCFFTPDTKGTLKVYSSGSSDMFGIMTSGSSLSTGIQQNAITADTIYNYDDDSGDSTNFNFTYDVSANTQYEINFYKYNLNSATSGTIYIEFTPAVTYSFQINYDANGGSNTPSSTSGTGTTTSKSLTISSTKPSRASSNFLGWSLSKTATKADYQPGQSITLSVTSGTSSTITLYAVWQVIPWTLYYQINEVVLNSSGTIVSQIDNVYSNNIPNISTYNYTFYSSSSSYTKKGYSIKAITTSADLNSNSSGISYNASSGASSSTSRKIIYYIFKPNKYTYSFNLNGGSGTINSVTGYYKENITIPITKPTKTNYRFLGWSTNSNATSAIYSAGKIITINDTSNVTLYAVWRPLFYWTGNKDIILQKNNLINTYINSTNVNTFQNLLKSYIDSTYNISTINQSTKITKDFYNIMAALLEITLLNTNDKITAQHWIDLQNAYNNYNPINVTDFEYVKNADNKYELTAWKGTLDGSPSTIIQIPEGGVII